MNVLRSFCIQSNGARGAMLAKANRASSSRVTSAQRPFSSYYAQKKEAKDRRRDLFERKIERQERLKTRRSGQPRDALRREFRDFFIKKKVDEEYMDRKARQAGLDWKINVAVILERQNIVLPDKEAWETEMENLQAHMMRYGKMYPKGLFDVDYEADYAMTDEELLAALPEGFTPAPRETEADASGDVRTTERKLKTSIYLTVQDDNDEWMLPTVTLQPDETLLEAAKRALADKIGPEVEFWCPSNCPCAVDMVAFPSEEERTKSGFFGTKTFFMKVVHDEGQVSKRGMKVKDYAWLNRAEITEKMKNEHGDYVAKFYHYLM